MHMANMYILRDNTQAHAIAQSDSVSEVGKSFTET